MHMTALIKPDLPLKFTVFLDGIQPLTKSIMKSIYELPQTQKLAELTENNPWHDYENGLSHVENVFANIQILLSLDFVTNQDIKVSYDNYLHQKVDDKSELTRCDLVLIGCALHDLSKGQIRPADDPVAPGDYFLITNPDGTTRGKGHEHASALMVPGILANRGLTPTEIEYVQNYVEGHDTFSKDFYTANLSPIGAPNPLADAQICRNQSPLAFELLIQITADEYGADITQSYRDYLLNEVVAKHVIITGHD